MTSPDHPQKSGAKPAESGNSPPSAPPLPAAGDAKPTEIGGPSGPEPTRYGDWERNGRCTDF